MTARDHVVFLILGVGVAVAVTFGFVLEPTYTDAYYYANVANRLVNGLGLTDAVLWTYIGMPEHLPTPSHIYWMPMTSLIAAGGMAFFAAPGAYWAAQVPFMLLHTLSGYSAFWLGLRLGGTRRHAYIAGLMFLLGGFYARYWGMTTTFTPYTAFGGGALIALGRGMVSKRPIWFALAGALTAGAHLTRADGLLFLLAGWAALFWFWDSSWNWRERFIGAGVLLATYVLFMMPWFVRNVGVIGTPLPTGGTQGIWYLAYNDIFNYPPDANPTRFFESGGWSLFLSSRWRALTVNLGTLFFVEGFVVLFPLMVVGLFRRLQNPFLRPFWIYGFGLHLAMTFFFSFSGYRGGLLHSSAALMPFWCVLALLGLDDTVQWIARRRRRWNSNLASGVFSGGILLMVAALSVSIGVTGRTADVNHALYDELAMRLPPDARLMMNDPSEMYYYIGFPGVVLPNENPDVIPEIALRYGITHVLLEGIEDDVATRAPKPLQSIPVSPPTFLCPVSLSLSDDTVRLYYIDCPHESP